jgi:hypothetical protein
VPKVFKLVEDLSRVATAKDREEGNRLQKMSNAMFMWGEIGEDYQNLRNAAEKHLGFWDWQTGVPEWKLIGNTKPTLSYPLACNKCGYLPAGSKECKGNDCPAYE